MARQLPVFLAVILAAASVPAAEPSGAAPEFSLRARSGAEVSLGDFDGEVVMINFWASWCAPCRQEMPHLEALHRRYRDVGFTLLGVNVDENTANAERWLEERSVSFEILYDPDSRVSELYGVIAMPTTVLIDRNGNRRFVHHGYQPGYEAQYQVEIRELVRE